VREALEAGRALEHVLIAKGRQDTRVEEIVQLARRNGVPCDSKNGRNWIAAPAHGITRA